MDSYKCGLVLSGGGVRGVAHIGVIKALLEYNIVPDVVSGSSAGAVVGALYCNGYTPEQMLEFFKLIPIFQVNKFALLKPGFIDTDKFYPDFKKYFPHDRFSGLEKKLFVTTVDLCQGDVKVFDQGDLIRPLLGSLAFPGLFSPILMDKVIYGDGGILDNFPIAPLMGISDRLIGVYASPLNKIAPMELKNSLKVLERAIRINYSKRSLAKFKHCDLMFQPKKLHDYALLDIGKIDEIFAIGYECAIETLKKEGPLMPSES
ncbi:patatin-like phospholipase family protein [Lutimonas sp.]|uniref:patatin-like phospholipase family protein n=1 Tax=Lutimonas sp. TaxID=1872403 RepID=UPI003D9BC8DF